MSDGKKMILTDEVKKVLLGLSPFSPEKHFLWTPKSLLSKADSLPAEVIPSYALSCFTIQEKDEVNRQLKKAESLTIADIRGLIRPKIHGFTQVYDLGDGSIMEYKGVDGGIDMAQLESLPKILIEEIFYYLIHASGIMDTERLGLR